MLEVHAPHEALHTWKGFFIHIATIVVGLFIAVASNRPSSTSTIGTRLRNWRNRFTTSSKATREPTQQIAGDNPRQRNKKRPCVGPFGAPSVPINRPLGGGCEQLPIPRHDHRVDDVDDAVRCSDITLPDVRSIDLHVRRGHHCRQGTTLNGHQVT
jgi:hypothetical protein